MRSLIILKGVSNNFCLFVRLYGKMLKDGHDSFICCPHIHSFLLYDHVLQIIYSICQTVYN
jgi:hypothetical protein